MCDKFKREKHSHLMNQDLSRKGSIDVAIEELVTIINQIEHYYTTSSCSGRIIVYSLPLNDESSNESSWNVKKKGTKWVFVSHDIVTDHNLITNSIHKEPVDNAYLKFEPFVLHACCDGIESAKTLMQAAVECGFRNSGISISKSNRVIVAVRSTHVLELPIVLNGKLIVTNDYIKQVAQLANKKMSDNFDRIKKFLNRIKNLDDF